MRKSDALFFELSKTEVIVIFVYYFLLLVIGGIVSVVTVCDLRTMEQTTQLMEKIILSSLSVCGMLCSVQYSKRLYKACITDRIVQSSCSLRNIGNLAYFLLRPFFAFAFVIVMIFALLSGMVVVTGSLDYVVNEKLLYLCVIISSFIGYSIGYVLDRFEDISKKKVEELSDV